MFCFYFGFQSLPSSVKVLTLFAQFLSKSFVSVQSIKNYISGVKVLHLYTFVSLLISMLLLHNCLFGLNVFTELGTKLLFLLIKTNACKNKHQQVASQASVTSVSFCKGFNIICTISE
jgi:hypothetical protein